MMDTLNRIGMALALTVTVMVAPSVHAAVLTSNLGEATAGDYAVDNLGPEAQGFTTDASHLVLGSVSLQITGVVVAGGNFTVRIFDDNAGLPGTMIPGGQLSGPVNPAVGINTYAPAAPLTLAPNTQ